MLFNLNKKSKLIKVSYHLFSCFISVHSCIFAAEFIDCSIIVHNLNLFKIMSLSYFKVVRVMCRSDFNNTCTKIHFNIFVRNNRNRFINKRKNYVFTNDVFISFIVRMYRNGCITKKCFRSCCCNYNMAATVFKHIFDMPEMALFFLVAYFRIGKSCCTFRTPVDNSVSFVDKAFFVKIYEYFTNSF